MMTNTNLQDQTACLEVVDARRSLSILVVNKPGQQFGPDLELGRVSIKACVTKQALLSMEASILHLPHLVF